MSRRAWRDAQGSQVARAWVPVLGSRPPAPYAGPVNETSRPGRRPAQLVAAAASAAQVLALLALVGFYIYEIADGQAADPVRAVASVVIMLLFGGFIAALARAWLRGEGWPRTPTLLWNALLLPVAWTVSQTPGQGPIGIALGVVAVAALVAAVAAPGRTDEPE